MSDNNNLIMIWFFFAGLEFFLFKYMLIPFFINRKCRNWEMTKGVIIESEYWSETSGEGETLWYVRLNCRYTVDGHEFTTDRYTLTDCKQRIFPSDNESAFKDNDRINEPIPVYYDPSYPAKAVLEMNNNGGIAVFFILNIVMIVYWFVVFNAKCL
jgi:hypothetical protein